MFGSKNIGWGADEAVSRGPTQAAREGGTGKGSENQVRGLKTTQGVENRGWGYKKKWARKDTSKDAYPYVDAGFTLQVAQAQISGYAADAGVSSTAF